ncbi:2Fe-2S iron-sulfur cluster-binding protein [Neiella marina]|uniref:2Fe-2S iron-sulfur cluster-binding protein n=1 Tax=Neiella marina TaxID=508461 RepID=UPI000B3C9AF4|nr:2Fe-2S iron-sulfur cluster binding domain-containing protein [Neiella marina]
MMSSTNNWLAKLFAKKSANTIRFADSEVALQDGESVLDGLLRAGHSVPYGCRGGSCQSCMMQCTGGTVPSASQQGLTAAQQELGYFLACSCHPSESMSVALKPAAEKIIAPVIDKSQLTANVVRLRIKAQLDYRAGQFINLFRNGAVSRSYSLASVIGVDDYIELHIKRVEGGKLSPWAYDDLCVGDEVAIEGPNGQCFYTPSDADQPLLLAGLGTGLAPLYGIVRDALVNHQHQGQIQLVVGGKHSEQLYLFDELKALSDSHPNLNVSFVAQQSTNAAVTEADIYQYCKELVPDGKGYKVFLCGAESFVKKMKKQCFLAGTNMADIAADAFVASGS